MGEWLQVAALRMTPRKELASSHLMEVRSSCPCIQPCHITVYDMPLFFPQYNASDPSDLSYDASLWIISLYYIVRLSVGSIQDYEGVDKMHTAMPPVVSATKP